LENIFPERTKRGSTANKTKAARRSRGRHKLASAGIDVKDPIAFFGVLARGHGMAVDLNRLGGGGDFL